MKCPDCGSRLAEVTFAPGLPAMRCFRCGGFWIDSNTANQLSADSLSAWRRISIDPVWRQGGKGTCPLDNTMLTRYIGDIFPTNVTAMRCVRCGKWWFPGDSLFIFKPALEAKANYLRIWGLSGDLAKVGLPILVAIFLIGGILTGVNLVKTKTQDSIPAAELVRQVVVRYVGDGVGVANFQVSGDKVTNLRYRLNKNPAGSRVNEEMLWSVARVNCEGMECQAQLVNLDMGREYVLEINGTEYLFVAQ